MIYKRNSKEAHWQIILRMKTFCWYGSIDIKWQFFLLQEKFCLYGSNKFKWQFFHLQESVQVSLLRTRNRSTQRFHLPTKSDCWQKQLQRRFSQRRGNLLFLVDEADKGGRKNICWVVLANSVKQKQANVEICQKCCGEIRQTKLQLSNFCF